MAFWSLSWIATIGRRCLFRLLLFLVRIWLRCDCRCLNLPEALLEKRFAALLLVFNFGIINLFYLLYYLLLNLFL